jgi:hypothetical protein
VFEYVVLVVWTVELKLLNVILTSLPETPPFGLVIVNPEAPRDTIYPFDVDRLDVGTAMQ